MPDFMVSNDVDTMMQAADADAIAQAVAIFSVLTHDTVKVVNQLALPQTYTNIGNLVVPSRPAGRYQIELSVTYDFNALNDSAFFRFRVDSSDPGDWNEFQLEPSDITDNMPFYYSYPSDYAAGPHTIELETRKENGTGTMNVYFADTSFFRIN